jgi:cob(I)alamin adenosyltransferase
MGDKPERRSVIATKRGDDGTTGLLFGRDRVFKDDLRTEAYGAIDEAVAALGMARAEADLKDLSGTLPRTIARMPELILRLQRELFVVGAELATAPGAEERQRADETRVTSGMVAGLDTLLNETEAAVEMPREFVVPGETRLSAALELARTIVRRAERRAVTIRRSDATDAAADRAAEAEAAAADQLIAYLNRLADLLWILARAAEQAEARVATPSNPGKA